MMVLGGFVLGVIVLGGFVANSVGYNNDIC